MGRAAAFMPSQKPAVAPPSPPLAPWPPLDVGDRGPDVASYQGYVDWSQVATVCTFGFTKASEGTNYVNPYYPPNWSNMGSLALRGVYHFARPNTNPAREEVAFFAGTVLGGGPLLGADVPVLDLEDGVGDLHDWTLAFLEEGAARFGTKVLLYSGGPFLSSHNCAQLDIAQASAGLWIAAYQSSPPPIPNGFAGSGLPWWWQHTDSATIPGVSGPCDESIYMGTL